MYFPFFFDSTFLLLIPALILAIYAQSRVKSTYQRYAQVRSRSGATGAQVARFLLNSYGLGNVGIEEIQGTLTDHYDPRGKVLRLSYDISRGNSLSALGIAAHEAGHAVQDGKSYFPLYLRNSLVPAANFGTWLAFPLFFIGFLFRGPVLMNIGILLYCGAVAFSVLTLPVEFNASRRALVMLKEGRFLDDDELLNARQVLNAAAFTYVAAVAMAIMQLIRLLLLRGRR